MRLRSTERSDGQQRPRWKDGSRCAAENQVAARPPSAVMATKRSPNAEHLVNAPLPREIHGSRQEPTRDRLADAGADAGLHTAGRIAHVCLAILPYGRNFQCDFGRSPL